MNRTLLLIILCACESSPRPAATIGRSTDNLDSLEARWIRGLDYDPSDAPLLWSRPDTLMVAHLENYSSADVNSSTCSGSGVFDVSVTTGRAQMRAIQRPACEVARTDLGAAIDPTGRWAVFSSRKEPNNSVLLRLDLTTAEVDTIHTGCNIYTEHPSWSNDGRSIAFQGICENREQENWRVYIVSADGTGLRELPEDSSYNALSPAWSNDNSRIVYVRDGAEPRDSYIAVMDTSGHRRKPLTVGGHPAWSPTGVHIAFIIERIENNTIDTEIRIIGANGTSERRVFRSSDPSTFTRGFGRIRAGLPKGPLVWAPDGQWLAFRRQFDHGTYAWRVHISSGDAHAVTQ